MALSGSLHDFDISYIFQIIAQEGKTGRLVLSSNDSEGYIVFKQGRIISAGTSKENLQVMLYNYLAATKACAEHEISGLRALYHNNLSHLSQKLLSREFLTPDQITAIIETGTEDIACGIFLWKQGNYRFDILQNVDKYEVGNFALSADAITMEAARRLDEWNRMTQNFTKDTVFIHSEAVSLNQSSAVQDPIEDFSVYLLTRIDGTSSVEFLCQESFFSVYQVNQALFELMENKKITPLPDKISSSIIAALQRKESSDIDTSKILLSSIITATCIAVIYFTGTILFNGILFSDSLAERHRVQTDLVRTQTNQKMAIGTLQYQAHHGSPPLSFRNLVESGTIDKRDLKDFMKSALKNTGIDQISK